jgi:hypothetical protein
VAKDFKPTSLACYGHTQDRPNPATITHFAWRSTPLFQPLGKIHQLDFVLDTHIRLTP